MSESYRALIARAAGTLGAAGVGDAVREARLLMRWAAGLGGAALVAAEVDLVSGEVAERFETAVRRRAAREPLSHITGRRTFWGREFEVSGDVLDPRPETECLVAEALNRGPFGRILDLGTGTGCILLSLLAEWPDAAGLGTDISADALAVAASNARRLGLEGRAAFERGDWLDGLAGPFDLIVSNPPYVTAAEMTGLAPELSREPAVALTPGGDGLDAYRAILPGAPGLLAPGGFLMIEIGHAQVDHVSALAASAGLGVHMIVPDFDHRPRVIVARS